MTARSNRQLGDPSPSQIVSRLREEADHCYSWSNGLGAQYAVHAHPYRKILYVMAGSITFTPEGDQPVTMSPGDRIEIPAGTVHGALVGAEGVTCWEGQARAKSVRDEAASGRSPGRS
ncbi:MAG TPA: cupin domain-containing protein [Candidatus Dormibacteraeota bacterium]|nr:cupin domain-containing protein [Candidatus Dormibacteraeota bacterium]